VQVEAADLRGADVDVVRARQVGSVGAAQEAEAVGQDFQGALAEDAFAFLGLILQQGEDQVLLAHPVGVFELIGGRHFHELCDVEVFEVGQMHEERPRG
jgi:hypothetical protein